MRLTSGEEELRQILGVGPDEDVNAIFAPDTEFGDVNYEERILGLRFQGSNGLALPDDERSGILKYSGVYLIINDYIRIPEVESSGRNLGDDITDLILNSVSRDQLLVGLKILSGVLNEPDELEQVIELLRKRLPEDAKNRLNQSLAPGPNSRVPLVRQGLLAAFRKVIENGKLVETSQLNPIAAALMLTHSVLATIREPIGNVDDRLGGLPTSIAVGLCVNQYFNASDDVGSRLGRTIRLWRDFGGAAAPILGGIDPTELLREATGLELEDLIAMAFAVLTHQMTWHLGEPPLLDHKLHPTMDETRWQQFIGLVAISADELVSKLTAPTSEWDYQAFESHPILVVNGDLLLVDNVLLLDRVTTGLYYYVLDHERAKGDANRQTWQKAWGKMVELIAEESLRTMAPILLGAGSTFFTEEDLEIAYPDKKKADVVIDSGDAMLILEVVSGQLKIESRVQIDPLAFREDLRKILFDKFDQLSETSENILSNPAPLNGSTRPPGRIQPVLLAGGRFPVNDVTTNEAAAYIADKRLFEDARNLPVAVIDLSELEMLEALHEKGKNPIALIRRWKSSDLSAMPLRNWIIREPGLEVARPARIAERMSGFLHEVGIRLGLNDDNPDGTSL